MRNHFTLHKDYTLYRNNDQLVLPLDLACIIPADDSVRLLSQFIERMFLGDLYRTYCREGSENEPTPRQMLNIIQYADFQDEIVEKFHLYGLKVRVVVDHSRHYDCHADDVCI